MKAKILSERFEIRSLNPEIDNLQSYLSWMRDVKANPYIQDASENYSMQNLINYVSDKNYSNSALLFGIFVKLHNLHIGNIKLEPIIQRKSATIGILIGEESWRGKGVGYEVITRVLEFCFTDLGLEFVELGVNGQNLKARDLYSRLGFKEDIEFTNSNESIKMSIRNPSHR